MWIKILHRNQHRPSPRTPNLQSKPRFLIGAVSSFQFLDIDSNQPASSKLTARVVLPDPAIEDSDEEPQEDAFIEEETDFLEGFPDDTEVSST